MYDNIIYKLTMVIDALGNVEVRGKNNLNNLGASIQILEAIRSDLHSLEATAVEKQE